MSAGILMMNDNKLLLQINTWFWYLFIHVSPKKQQGGSHVWCHTLLIIWFVAITWYRFPHYCPFVREIPTQINWYPKNNRFSDFRDQFLQFSLLQLQIKFNYYCLGIYQRQGNLTLAFSHLSSWRLLQPLSEFIVSVWLMKQVYI